jgi:methyl-accepting chemotaxis protein
MDQVTQRNAALVEQSAAAAESLKLQAAQLVKVVAVFKFDFATCAPAYAMA